MNESFKNLMINSYELANLRGKYERLQEENAQLKKFVQEVHDVIQAPVEFSECTWQAYRPLYKPLERVMNDEEPEPEKSR